MPLWRTSYEPAEIGSLVESGSQTLVVAERILKVPLYTLYHNYNARERNRGLSVSQRLELLPETPVWHFRLEAA